MNTISINFDNLSGIIKPMHAVNNAPCVPVNRSGMFDKLKEASVPFARLHDTGGRYGGSRYVDIANVFPNFDADENDPASYDFAFTDVLLSELKKYDIQPFYRLGCTIENMHYIKAYNILPPKDFEKWARICEHIIRHYNEGWANGFHMGIEYWEIWNEPDNEPEIKDNPMWKGTAEQFFEMYDITSKHLKNCFPHLKIGGYGSCGFYALSDKDFSETAHSSTRVGYFIDFLNSFLAYIKANGSVLDFFSWHSYAGVKDNVLYAEYARKKLDEYGYTDIEIFLNEWNPGIAHRGALVDASNILAMMCALHETPTDMLMYYDASVSSSYCGIFNPLNDNIFKAYYAFYTFGKLYCMGHKAHTEICADNIYALAAAGNGKKAFVITNQNDFAISLKVNIQGANAENAKVYATDELHEFDEISDRADVLEIPAYGIRYVEF